MLRATFFILALASTAFVGQPTEAARILALFPMPGPSHFIMLGRIINELVDRGHEVDMVSNFALRRNDTGRYNFLEISPKFDFWADVLPKLKLPSVFEMSSITYDKTVNMLYTIGESTTEYALQHPVVQQLIHDPNPKHYDLIIVEQFYQEAFLMLAHQYKAPVVSVFTIDYALYFDAMFGSISPWSHVPHELIVLPARMTFWQRVQNVQRALLDKFNRKYYYLRRQQELADKYFAHLPTDSRPSLEELMQRVSLMLMNSYVPLVPVRPLVPGLIEVGGVHIDPPKQLPSDIQEFLDGATDGAIYFSFGTQVPSSSMPEKQLNSFLRTFVRFPKQRILWKWETDLNETNAMPANVLAKKWMPQGDILAHPNVRLFITHGGLLGTQESVWNGVPMLGIPFYTDQHHNTQNVAKDGYGLALQFSNVTDESLHWAIDELLHNPAYAERAQKASRIFRDRPESAIDRAVYWIEYTIRFGGTEHLRSAGADLSWFSYFLLDIVAAGLAALLALVFVLRFAWRKLFGGYRANANAIRKTSAKKNK